uniref:Uncharacterized protein n=1 Tax=Meloidogyne hapla TaxID=6305 RepID=A0A1I8B2Y5_MELHA
MHNVTSFELNYLGLDSEEFTKLEEFTLEERLIAWILIIMEYFVQFINIPFGVINIRIIYSTSFILSILNFVYKEDQEQSDNLSSQKVSLTTALIAILLALIGLIEIILMGVIWHYNKNKLTKKFTNSSQLSIIGGKPVVVINVHRRTSDYKLKKRYQSQLNNLAIACINLLIISTTIFEIFCCVPKMKKLQNQSTINKISPTLAQQQTERYFAMLKGTWE